MGFNDKQLEELAKALAGESFENPNYIGFSESEDAVDLASETFPTEVGSRKQLAISRTVNVVTLNAVRSATDVVDTVNGDDLRRVGTFNTGSSTIPFEDEAMGKINHTINFDIDFNFDIEVDRN